MAEFRRSRLSRKTDEQVTKKTVFMGLLTILLFIVVIVFGLPFLVSFSLFLGTIKKDKDVIKEKVLPPVAPRIIIPYEATNSSKISIVGTAEAGVKVELLKNDMSVGKQDTTTSGEYIFDNVTLEDGENVFTALAVSEGHGTSEISSPVKILYDNKAPALVMTNPSEESISVDTIDYDIVGESEKGVSVTVNGHVAMVDNDGKFKLKIQLNSGNNDIEVIVKDLAGNETKRAIKIKSDI